VSVRALEELHFEPGSVNDEEYCNIVQAVYIGVTIVNMYVHVCRAHMKITLDKRGIIRVNSKTIYDTTVKKAMN